MPLSDHGKKPLSHPRVRDISFVRANRYQQSLPVRLLPYRSVLCGRRIKEDFSHLDRKTARFSALARPRKHLVHVSAFQYPETAYMLLGLQIRPVGDEQLTVGLRPQCMGLAQAASKFPDAGSNHF